MSTEFQVQVRPTSYTVYPGKEALTPLRILLYTLEYEDEFQEQLIQLGYILDEKHDILYLHKGVSIDYLRKLLQNVRVKFIKPDEGKEMDYEYEEVVPPRNNEQVDVINFIAGLQHHASNINDNQLFLVKNPGFG
jgi:DNA-dependent RNA polymerase auxiliary subunit epsilon